MANWNGWTSHGAPGGGFIGAPAIVSRNPAVCNIYVQGADNALWQKAFFSGSWHDWGRHNDGGTLASMPAPGSMGPDHEHVFVRGTDGAVWSKAWTGASGWSGWTSHGAPAGGFIGAPAIVSHNPAGVQKLALSSVPAQPSPSMRSQVQRVSQSASHPLLRQKASDVLASSPDP